MIGSVGKVGFQLYMVNSIPKAKFSGHKLSDELKKILDNPHSIDLQFTKEYLEPLMIISARTPDSQSRPCV